jgi:glycosyltransferase involved in cell wall biosynthesis
MSPLVSIILPAFNCERFVAKTMDSLLQQTFTNFELLVINDGSTDATEAIIQSYSDSRIRYLKNDGNKGLVHTLNRGLQESFGTYIARIDADDMALPHRLAQQVNWLDEHPETAVVGSFVTLVDELGNDTGYWPLDIAVHSAAHIRKTMLKENCIAHPSVMMRGDVVRKYLYAPQQQHTEDYDLWLRLLADGYVIEKIPEKLLLYRVHTNSITGTFLRKTNPFFKQFHCKRKVLLGRLKSGKWNAYDWKLLVHTVFDGLMGIGKQIKQSVS